ncbi:hypothetical protein B0H67DRAFT_549905 [Lasiosphaeris hirsuta]|uniref:Uncharacterized protein n=1 Tax=Lasiosphaeris hirsuta TaxID=260670 RepID=A0AA40E8M0_9PEZI|nr:hypothetical protein B0H67DRAFT_549905 [Lasiosphaeris hirsuta]
MPRKLLSLLSRKVPIEDDAAETSKTGAGIGARPGWVRRVYESAKQWVSSEYPQTAFEVHVSEASPEKDERRESDQTAEVAHKDPEILPEVVVLVPTTTLLSNGTRIFNAFRKLVGSKDDESAAIRTYLVTESERFALWAQSLGLRRQGHASLDYKVRDATVVRLRLEDLLGGLATHLEELGSVVTGERQPLEREYDDEDASSSSASSSQGADGDHGPITAETASASSERPSSSDSFHEIDFRQRSITETIDALYSLATKMRNPRNRPRRTTRELYKHIPPELREQYMQEREDAEIMIVSSIQRRSLSEAPKRPEGDKEPLAPAGTYAELGTSAEEVGGPPNDADDIEYYASPSNFLVKRIGISNARGKQHFVYWKEHAARIRGGPTTTTHSTEQPTSVEWKGTPLDVVPTATQAQIASRVTPSAPRPTLGPSLATSATRQDEGALAYDYDMQSVISHRSRVPTAFSGRQGPKLEWPSPPAHLGDDHPKFITCP